ncbi:hypothetical protein BsWGS_15656 [Bradybaena similaris]
MLVVVVLTFASLWMPYRVMVVYNSFAQHKYVDIWFLLFARTMIYVNCAINPVLYNIMSVKFKRAFRNHLSCWHRRFSIPSHTYSEVPTDVWATKRITFSHNQTSLEPQQPVLGDTVRIADKQHCIVRQISPASIEKQQSEFAHSNANSIACSSSLSANSSVAEQTV